jgi:hypothetical protein
MLPPPQEFLWDEMSPENPPYFHLILWGEGEIKWDDSDTMIKVISWENPKDWNIEILPLETEGIKTSSFKVKIPRNEVLPILNNNPYRKMVIELLLKEAKKADFTKFHSIEEHRFNKENQVPQWSEFFIKGL